MTNASSSPIFVPMRLHHEGKVLIPLFLVLIGLVVALAFWFLPANWQWLSVLLAVAGAVFFGLILNFFRNPVVPIHANENHIIAPCDGKVVVIEEVEDPLYFKGKVTQVSIFMSPLNVHVCRLPIGGKVKMFSYIPGKFLVAFNPKSSQLNEQTFAVVENKQVTVAFKQIAGYVARRIRWYIKEGDSVEQGKEYGFIKFGSRIDILLPTDCKIEVNLDDKVLGAQTVIASV